MLALFQVPKRSRSAISRIVKVVSQRNRGAGPSSVPLSVFVHCAPGYGDTTQLPITTVPTAKQASWEVKLYFQKNDAAPALTGDRRCEGSASRPLA